LNDFLQALQALMLHFALMDARRMQNLHALAASALQSRSYFAMTLGEQIFDSKKITQLKKSKISTAIVLSDAYRVATSKCM